MIDLTLPCSEFGVVSRTGSPPTAATRQSPEPGSMVPKTMVPSVPQLAPNRVLGSAQMVDVGPPPTETRRSTGAPARLLLEPHRRPVGREERAIK